MGTRKEALERSHEYGRINAASTNAPEASTTNVGHDSGNFLKSQHSQRDGLAAIAHIWWHTSTCLFYCLEYRIPL